MGWAIAVTPGRCDSGDPGTREGLILVPAPPPTTLDSTAATRASGTDDDQRRRELADFLRTRRAALQPGDVGLPAGGRRRTPGLRREEVALLAGVGTTWYTWLEQARDVRASREVLEALASALQLTDAEREHLILLGRAEGPPPPAPVEQVSPAVRRLVEGLGPNPAYVLGRRCDYLAWNDALSAVFGDPADLPPHRRNHVWRMFVDPNPRILAPTWETSARNVLARFRAYSARHVGDPWFEDLIEDLRATSPEFRTWWKQHEVRGEGDGKKVIVHPVVGRMEFEHASFWHADTTDHRLVLYTPVPGEHDTPAKVERLVADRRASRA